MQIKVKIDQKACLAKGLDAPASYYLATISPATLSVEVRTWLSQHMLDEITVSGISFAIPKPTQGDLEQMIAKQIRIEHTARQNEQTALANLFQLLSEEEKWLYNAGLLPTATVLKAVALALHPRLEVLSKALTKTRSIDALHLGLRPREQAKSTPVLIWHLDKTHAVQYEVEAPDTGWHESADGTWVEFIKAVETAGFKVSRLLSNGDCFKVEIVSKTPEFPVQLVTWLQINTNQNLARLLA
jgi:hypothetical protein